MFESPLVRSNDYTKGSVKRRLIYKFIAAEQHEIRNHGHDVTDDATRKFTKIHDRPIKKIERNGEKKRQTSRNRDLRKRKKGRKEKKYESETGSSNELDLEEDLKVTDETPEYDIESISYLGLYSNELYNYKGEIIRSDLTKKLVSFYQEEDYDAFNHEFRDGLTETDTEMDGETDVDLETDAETEVEKPTGASETEKYVENQRGKTGGIQSTTKLFDIVKYGLDIFPKAIQPLDLVSDSKSTINLIEGRHEGAQISKRTRQILTKNNLAFGPVDSKFRYSTIAVKPKADVDEEGNKHGRLVRHSNIVNSLMKLSILRRDYSLACRAFAILMHFSETDIRYIWTIGLELLVWRRELRDNEEYSSHGNNCLLPHNNDIHTLPSKIPKVDEEFLEWLILNYPSGKNSRPSHYRKVPESSEFYQHLLLTKMRHSDPKTALNRLEDMILIPPFSEDPIYYALSGIAVMQLMTQRSIEYDKSGMDHLEKERKMQVLADRAHKYFESCHKFGGVLPEDFINFEISQLVRSEEEENKGDEEDEENEENEEGDEGGDGDDGGDEADDEMGVMAGGG